MDIMKAFSFSLPTRIEFGVGCISGIAGELSALSSKNPLIVTDRGIVASNLLERVTKPLDEAGVAYEIYDNTDANPREENVHEGAALARKAKSDCLIAVGGGSPIDCAKAISVMATHDGVIRDFAGVEKIPGGTIPLIAVPTTAGSGSEVTFSSVITNLAGRTKFTLRSVKIAAKAALCDPALSVSMPRPLTAATGMDALTHAIEGYTAVCAEPIANAVALYAIGLVSKYLRRAACDGGDVEARAGMLMASLLAAISFSHSDVAAVHCIAESIGGLYDKPHGVCNAVCLPEVMDYSKDHCVEKYANVARAMGLSFASDEEGAAAAVAEVKRLSADVGIPPFSALEIPESRYRRIAEKSYENLSSASNPRPLSADDYIGILRRLGS